MVEVTPSSEGLTIEVVSLGTVSATEVVVEVSVVNVTDESDEEVPVVSEVEPSVVVEVESATVVVEDVSVVKLTPGVCGGKTS